MKTTGTSSRKAGTASTPGPTSSRASPSSRPDHIIAPCSNGHIAQSVNLAKYAKLPWDAILGAEIARAYKPDPAVYLKSVEALGLEPHEVCMVAAHRDDLIAAAAVGLKTAFVPRPQEPEGPPVRRRHRRLGLPGARVKHLIAGWLTVGIFLLFGDDLLSKDNLDSVPLGLGFFAWLLVVILWCAFGVIVAADHLAEMLGEPYGTLILTFSIVAIEVMLISTVMLGGGAPTVGRDTMFAVMMIVLNGVIGLSLVVGGLRHHTQDYSLPGATAYLSVIIPLVTIALILPSVTTTTDAPTLSTTQSVVFALATIVLYVIFIVIQTGRHRDLFVHGPSEEHEVEAATARHIARWVALLVAGALPIVLLSKSLDKVVDAEIDKLGAPGALTGVLIAMIVFTPEGISALKAASHNQLQRTVNLCLGACLSTLGLTLPAVLTIGLITGETVILGVDPTGMVLIALTLLLSVVTFSGPRTTVLEGAVHLLVFLVYIVLVFSP